MGGLARSKLLQEALAPCPNDPDAEARARLCASYLSFRRRASMLAGEISRNFRGLTVHDETHLDALWEMADLAAGDDLVLNPLAAYVLGGAILLHDLGLSVAAYASGENLRSEPRWSDAIAVVLEPRLAASRPSGDRQRRGGRITTGGGIALRRLHAVQAEKLALASWTRWAGRAAERLFEDSERAVPTGRQSEGLRTVTGGSRRQPPTSSTWF